MKHGVKRLPRAAFDKKAGADIRVGDVLSDWHESTEGESLVAVAGLVTADRGSCDQGTHVELNGSIVGCYDRAGHVLILRRDA